MKINRADFFYDQPATDAEIETFKKFLDTYEVGDIKIVDKTKFKNKSDTIRILVAGDVGSGKTSFIKTLLRICGNQRESRLISTGWGLSSNETDTVTLKYYRLTETTRANYFICDSPGFPVTTIYQDVSMMTSHVKRFVDGYVRKGETILYPCSWFQRHFGIRYADSTMDAVIFIARPPLDIVGHEMCKLNNEKLMHLKRVRQELEKTLGDRPFFLVITATDSMAWATEEVCREILEVFDGSVFIVGKEEEGMCMPSVKVYTELISSIFASIEEYRLDHI
ncbi:hypothetical protein BC938DRAFT_479745 [Jimgerdemannia flammicorona]|uniref:G domain-containing protein n=1 Tax=Jimgerdemannia flammicorona TaxID=994334 RepID=A0A433QXW0_9FUNG|nr:hypothetical protein BC938DRAFT_479745 [Jimgerdemannia flammicorona]